MAYADALNMEEEETLCAVHFAESGTEEIIRYTKDNKAVVIINTDILDGVPKINGEKQAGI